MSERRGPFPARRPIFVGISTTLFLCFLPNPHWVEELRPLTGLTPEIQDYVGSFELTEQFMDRMTALLDFLLPAFVNEGRSVLTVAFGCTGGRHRSVAIAERRPLRQYSAYATEASSEANLA